MMKLASGSYRFALAACCMELLFVSLSFGQVLPDEPDPLSPSDALNQFVVSDGFELQLVLSEPQISQPVFFNFDERGRLWVMNYLQYPNPAGLKMLSRDKFWRAVYDKVPNAPPNHVRGADKITIHEDSDNDGVFDKHKTFVEGLSIATSFVRGRGGVWVLNPPYLLFYPDKDNDDVPDGDPVVHLEGFGLEDTHSCANSLRWGPDGWLYAAQGSTVTGNIRKPGDKKVIHSLGQLIWRYHPEKQIYEIFAEGGGNTFGVEFDSSGRLFSGHNGGDTRGFHYVQGGYYRKGFGKHGPLSNPYAFGYFKAMKHHKVSRFVHNFVIYESIEFPMSHRNNLYGVEPMQGQIVRTEMISNGTSFETKDIERIVKSDDKWFRPVDIKVGPDGAIYFADFYEPQISHREHFQGQIDKENGRIYRLVAKTSKQQRAIDRTRESGQTFDLSEMKASELVAFLEHPNKWFRQTAVRCLFDQKDSTALPQLINALDSKECSTDVFWAINACGGFDSDLVQKALKHESPDIRIWALRLLTDSPTTWNDLSKPAILAELLSKEKSPRVRSQILSTAKILGGSEFLLPFLQSAQEHDFNDPHIPTLLWWAVESECQADPGGLLTQLRENPSVWENQLFNSAVAQRLMRRFALAGTRRDYGYCVDLFKMAPNKSTSGILMGGFEAAFKGRSMTGLPRELNIQLAKAGGDSLTFRMRLGDPAAIDEATKIIEDGNFEKTARVGVIETFGEISSVAGEVLTYAIQSEDEEIQLAGLQAAKRYKARVLGSVAVEEYPQMTPDVQEVARSMLASRKIWSVQFLDAVNKKTIEAKAVPISMVRKMAIHDDEQIHKAIRAHWENIGGANSTELRDEFKRITSILQASKAMAGEPFAGKKIFAERCGRCHLMYGEGGFVGPDLTTHNRNDTSNVLLNIINPNAEIREGFENYKVLTEDGQIITGFIMDQDNKVVVVRGSDGKNVAIEQAEIEDMSVQKTSIMPEGLLSDLNDQQIRDLFAFIRSSQPLN